MTFEWFVARRYLQGGGGASRFRRSWAVGVMTFEWFVARRYLQGGGGASRFRRDDRFLSVITVIAVAAVAAGVTALVLALAINAGFRETFEERLLGGTPPAHPTPQDAAGLRDYHALAARLRGL